MSKAQALQAALEALWFAAKDLGADVVEVRLQLKPYVLPNDRDPSAKVTLAFLGPGFKLEERKGHAPRMWGGRGPLMVMADGEGRMVRYPEKSGDPFPPMLSEEEAIELCITGLKTTASWQVDSAEKLKGLTSG